MGFGGEFAVGEFFGELLVGSQDLGFLLPGFFGVARLQFGNLEFEELSAFPQSGGGGFGHPLVKGGDFDEVIDGGVAFVFVFLDEAAEEHRPGTQFGRGVGGADDLRQQGDGFVAFALLAQGGGDAVIGFEHFGRPRVKGLQFLEEGAGAGDVALFLRDAAESEKRDGLRFLDGGRGLGGFLSGGIRVIDGDFFEDGFGFGGLAVFEKGQAVEVEVGGRVDERRVVGLVHFLERAARVAFADESGAGEEDFAFGAVGRGGGEIFEIFFHAGSVEESGGDFGLLDGEEGAQAESELGAVRIGGGHFFRRGDGGGHGRFPFFLLLGSEGAEAAEFFRGGTVKIGDFLHGLGGLGCGGVFFREGRVGGDGGSDVAAVGFGLADAVEGEEDFVVLRIFFHEGGHEADDFVGVLRGAGELGALEVGERRGLALREFFRDLGHSGDGFVIASEGKLGRGGGIHGAGGQLGVGVFFDEGVDEREGSFVVAFLLRADGDPEFGFLDLGGLGEFGRDFFVSGDGFVPLALIFEDIADAELGDSADFGRGIGGEKIAVGLQRAFEIALLGAGGGFVDHGQTEEGALRINFGGLFEILRGFFRIADVRIGVGEEEVTQRDREIRGDGVAPVRALERIIPGHGGLGGVLRRVGHGQEVEIAFFVLIVGQQRFDVREDDAGFVVLSGLEIALADFLQGRGGLVGARLQFREFAPVAFGPAVEALEFVGVARGQGGAAQGRQSVDFFLLEGDHLVFGQHLAEGGAGLLEEAGLALCGGEGRFVEEDFPQLKLRGVDQGQIGFPADDLAQETGGFGIEREGRFLVGGFAGEHLAALRGVDEREEILAVEDAGAAGKPLQVGLEGGLGRGEIPALERGDGAAVVGGFDLGRPRVFPDEGRVFFHGFPVVGFACGVVGRERGGQARQGLGFEEGGQFREFRSGRGTGQEFPEDVEGLAVFAGEVVGKSELHLRVGDDRRRGVIGKDFLVGGGRGGVVAADINAVGRLEGLLRAVLGEDAGGEEERRQKQDAGQTHAVQSSRPAGGGKACGAVRRRAVAR